MKRTHALLVVFMFAFATVCTAVSDYQAVQSRIADDLTQALCRTASERPNDWLSTDTIRRYRNHLQLPQLRDKAVLLLCVSPNAETAGKDGLSGQRVTVRPGISAYGRVTLSAFDVWYMADHRLSLFFTFLTLAWMAFSLRYTHRRVAVVAVKDSLVREGNRYLDATGRPLHLTPMQRQLMDMFLVAPAHELSKEEICSAFWPCKDDPSDTLYALISRLKATLESQTPLRITSERGRSYRLTEE